ncbi:MAG: hypothetical protein WCO02_12920 [Bacteroidota bacterium]
MENKPVQFTQVKSSWEHIYGNRGPEQYYTELKEVDYGHYQDELLDILKAHKLDSFGYRPGKTVKVADIGCSYGNTSLMFTCGFTWAETVEAWKGERPLPGSRKRFQVYGIDLSENALQYGLNAGIYDSVLRTDLNDQTSALTGKAMEILRNADVLLMSMSSCYFDMATLRLLFTEFLSQEPSGKLIIYDVLDTFETRDLSPDILLPEVKPSRVIRQTAKHRNLTAEEQMKLNLTEARTSMYILGF